MPELPEVETTRRGLIAVLAGSVVEAVVCRRPDLRFPLPGGFAGRVTGRRCEGIDRLGKFLLIRLEGGLVWVSHLGMSGRFRILDAWPPANDPHDHVLIRTSNGAVIVYHDPRRFGFMDLVDGEAVAGHAMLGRLGPDPLSPGFTAEFLADQLSRRRGPVKPALIDQSVVAGMGNIYGSESLFRAGISPIRVCASIPRRRVGALVAAVREVFADAIDVGGSTLRDHRQPDGELGYFQHQFAVYGRAGLRCAACDCDPERTGGVKRVVQGGRATYYCPRRQK